MRITPLDIRRQEFKKSMRGFDPDEVYAFLNTVAEEYEAALTDNKGLREHIVNLKARVDEFKSMETNLRNTLLTAQKLTSDAKENARHEAGLILREAEVEAEKASENIRSHTRQLRREILELKKQKDNYLTRLKTLIENHREMIKGFEDDFAQSDEEIANLESRIKEDSRKSVQHRRMSREKITEKFARKPAEKEVEEENAESPGSETGEKRVPQDSGGAREKDNISRQKTGDERPSQSPAETGLPEHEAERDIEESPLENLNADEFQQDSDEAVSADEVDVEAEKTESDEWGDYEVRKQETDWENYEISSEDDSVEDGFEEALSGLTEETGQREHESDVSDDREGLSAYAESESNEAESSAEESRDNPQGEQQSERYQMTKEGKETGEEDRAGQPDGGPDSEEKADEDGGTWSMDRLKENVTNIGKQDS
ncbi:MAG TPA: DivIVA domain-containing protein [Candidatus Krumholzibacteriaceae bacterium]|nr:DivIVA domain-containing protein [Candidatus Krumholzibacteriaceae bacterium]